MINYFQSYITLEEVTKTNYNVFWGGNGKLIGNFICDDDGFFYFWSLEESSGCWESHTLKEIADKLDELNEPWNKQINQYFEEQLQKNLEL